MENEIMELENMDQMDEMVVVDETYERSGSKGAWAIVAGCAALAVGAAVLFVRKNKGKLEERKIEKLRKKGYVIYKPDTEDLEPVECEHVFEEDEN